jgi:hypothetical protein
MQTIDELRFDALLLEAAFLEFDSQLGHFQLGETTPSRSGPVSVVPGGPDPTAGVCASGHFFDENEMNVSLINRRL